MRPRMLHRGFQHVRMFVLRALLAVGAVSTLVIGPAHAAQTIKITETADPYAKVTTLATEKFKVPDVGSFFDPAFAHVWLSAILDPGFTPSVGLKVYYQRANGWRFFDRAFDSDGNLLKVDVLARDVQYGSTVVEQFMVKMSMAYLQSHRATGLDIRFDGKGGSLVVQLPAAYVQAMLDRLGSQTEGAPSGSAAIMPSVAASNQPSPVPQKLRLGIRYMDEAMAAKMPETVRSSLPATGLLLVRVEPGSPAATAGLQVGDVLVEFAGAAINLPADMTRVMNGVQSGSNIEAVVMRAGKTVRVVVQFE